MNESIDFEFTQASPSKGRRRIWVIAAAVILISLITLIVIMILLTSPTRYHIFTKSRIAKMEDYFDITVTDNIKLLQFEDNSLFIATHYALTLETADYEAFLKHNIRARTEQFEPEYQHSKSVIYYRYLPDHRTTVQIAPADSEGMYRITLIYSD